MKIDYELAKKIGATHYNYKQETYVRAHHGKIQFYDEPLGSWVDALWNTFDVIKSIPPQKPTRTEYVKVTDSIFDLRPDLEAGELYFKMSSGDYHNIDSEDCLIASAIQKVIYRRIEKPVDWRDEIKQDFAVWFGNGKVGLKMNFSEENFLEMCRVALRANGELPTA